MKQVPHYDSDRAGQTGTSTKEHFVVTYGKSESCLNARGGRTIARNTDENLISNKLAGRKSGQLWESTWCRTYNKKSLQVFAGKMEDLVTLMNASGVAVVLQESLNHHRS